MVIAGAVIIYRAVVVGTLLVSMMLDGGAITIRICWRVVLLLLLLSNVAIAARPSGMASRASRRRVCCLLAVVRIRGRWIVSGRHWRTLPSVWSLLNLCGRHRCYDALSGGEVEAGLVIVYGNYYSGVCQVF